MESTASGFAENEKPSLVGSLPYIAMHLFAVVGVLFIWTPTWELAAVAVGAYYLRMFGITAGYHRYFAHRGFKTGRVFQFVLAWLGTMASQKGVLWWSGHHRHHHKHSDQVDDIHSPQRGFWWSHHGWILCDRYNETPAAQLKEFAAYPELRFLNTYWVLGPVGLAVILGAIGGWSWAFYGAVVSTVFLWHGTFTINSLAHVWGSRRYETTDTSRNNFWLALLTMGEGWHNNHHHYQSTARNGFFWWEVDASYYLLVVLSWFGVVWDLRQPPAWLLEGRPDARTPAGPVPNELPSALLDAMARLSARRDELRDAAASSLPELRRRIGEAAAHAAELAAEAAETASEHASDLASRAAELAAEAEAVALEMTRGIEAKLPPAWAEAASCFADRARAAAERSALARA